MAQIQNIYDRFGRGELTPDEASTALTAAGLTNELEEPDPTLDNNNVFSIFMESKIQGLRLEAPQTEEELVSQPPALPSQIAA